MPVTITAGVTFSGGGLTMAFAPPTVATAGWFGGGLDVPGSPTCTVDRITYATDTATASVRGPLTIDTRDLAAAGTLTYGWYTGGYQTGILSTVERVTYSSDTSNLSIRGPLSFVTYRLSATSDTTTYGWFGTGTSSPFPISAITRITYANDTATASSRGPLTASGYSLTATGSTSYGWFAGGNPGPKSSIDRIDYANDTATASTRGPLTATVYKFAGAVTDVNTYGWFAGGRTPTNVSTVSRLTYANDTVTTTNRGPLSASIYSNAGTNSDGTYGWLGGGLVFSAGGQKQTVITRITYATDTATSTNRSSLSQNRASLTGSAGLQ